MVVAVPVRFAGAVLCGGASTRMGQDKALLEVEGAPMAARVAAALRAAGATEVFAVGGNADGLLAAGLPSRPDAWPGDGPLPATVTALEAATEAIVVVLACDLLHPSARAITATVDALVAAPAALGAVPVHDGHRQWVHVAWRAEAAGALRGALEGGARSLRRAAPGLPLVDVPGLSAEALLDADEPADLPPEHRAPGRPL